MLRPLLALLLVLCAMLGCAPSSSIQPQPQSQKALLKSNQASPTPSTATSELSTDSAQTLINLSDLVLERDRTGAFNTNGDLRPFWIVSGRITNLSGSTVTILRLKLIATEKNTGHDLDTAVITIKQEIPKDATVSFRRDVQLMLPASGWGWICLVDGATIKP